MGGGVMVHRAFGSLWKASLCREYLNLISMMTTIYKKKEGSDSLKKEKRVDMQRHRGVDGRVSDEKNFRGA